ncbi:6-bladed beta-propeller [Roseivirga pacifica]|uniref:6-bladed beta-propeller n=1 Tax=Roseivirga pacifica TaxID=1267423 RepID=UPI003BAFEBB8
MKRLTFSLLILISTIFCCDKTRLGTTNLNKENITTIDVSNVKNSPEKISPISLLYDIEYLKLDTDSFFVTETQKIIEFRDYLLIHDKNKRKLAVFSMDGSFVQEVGKQGLGPSEYKSIYDFDVDLKRGLIYVLSRGDLAYLVYDEKFNFLKKIQLEYWPDQISVLKNGSVAIYEVFENSDEYNISIHDKDGKLVSKHMPYPMNREYHATDYTGFISKDFYTYPFSSIIYELKDNGSDSALFEIKIPNQRSNELKFDQASYFNLANKENEEIIGKFTIGSDNEELFFSYSLKTAGRTSFPVGIRLKSGEIFSHANMYHGAYFQDGDFFTTLFLLGFYSLPSYSEASRSYYVATNFENMTEYFFSQKDRALREAREKAPELYEILSKLPEDKESVIILKFKLKPSFKL